MATQQFVPSTAGTDVDVSTPVLLDPPTPGSASGTPGTGGLISYGTYHGQPVPQPHQVWKFDIKLPPLGVKEPIVQAIEPGFDNIHQIESHPIGGRHYFLAGFFDATELRLMFYDDEDHTPIEYIYAWKRLIRNYNSDTGLDDGTYGYAEGDNGYLKNIDVFLQNMKNDTKYKITYRKCFPTVMAPLKLDYEPSGRTVIAQAFAVNRIITKKITGVQASTANPSPVSPTGAAFSVVNIQRIQP